MEHEQASDSSEEMPQLRIEREHLPDGRAITYYSRGGEAESDRPTGEPGPT